MFARPTKVLALDVTAVWGECRPPLAAITRVAHRCKHVCCETRDRIAEIARQTSNECAGKCYAVHISYVSGLFYRIYRRVRSLFLHLSLVAAPCGSLFLCRSVRRGRGGPRFEAIRANKLTDWLSRRMMPEDKLSCHRLHSVVLCAERELANMLAVDATNDCSGNIYYWPIRIHSNINKPAP